MKKVRHENGVILSYDNTIIVGDYITAYHKGIHIVTKIEDRGRRNCPLFHYVSVLNSQYGPMKKRENSCDASYCTKVSKKILLDRVGTICQTWTDNINGYLI